MSGSLSVPPRGPKGSVSGMSLAPYRSRGLAGIPLAARRRSFHLVAQGTSVRYVYAAHGVGLDVQRRTGVFPGNARAAEAPPRSRRHVQAHPEAPGLGGGMEQQVKPAVGQVGNEGVLVSPHPVNARHLHPAEARGGEGLQLGREVFAIDRTAHPPPSRPGFALLRCLGTRQVRRLPQGDLGRENHQDERPRERPHYGCCLVCCIQNGALTNQSTVPTRSRAVWLSQLMTRAKTRNEGTSVRPRPAREISLRRVVMRLWPVAGWSSDRNRGGWR